jgi:hypothetical protein
MESYEEILERIPAEVSLGYQTILVFRYPALQALQIGYSITPTGESLNSGWPKEWIVIATEELCGDPIFIDASTTGFPVYTATHGQGHWEAERIAVSLESFGRALKLIEGVSRGREHPVALDRNPISPAEKESVLAAIEQDNPRVKQDFWEAIFQQD